MWVREFEGVREKVFDDGDTGEEKSDEKELEKLYTS